MSRSDAVHVDIDSFFGLSFTNGGVHVSNIHLAENGILIGELRNATPLPGQTNLIWRCFAAIVVILVGCWLLSYLGVQTSMILGSAMIGGLSIFAFQDPLILKKDRRDLLRRRILDCRFESRLWAIGHGSDAEQIAELTDVPFEPVIIPVERTYLRPAIGILIALVLSLGFVIGLRSLMPFQTFMAVIYFTIPIIGIIAWLIPKFTPAYYRITPGRLELLRFSALRRHTPDAMVRTWDLRNADIQYVGNAVEIAETGDFSNSTLINARQFGDPREFVYSLFRAAISTHESPLLPTDRLTIE